MPGNNLSISATVSIGPGFYYTDGSKSVGDLVPSDRFTDQTTPFGDHLYETVLREGDDVRIYYTFANEYYSWSWTSPIMGATPTVTAEQVGRARIILSDTARDGYIKIIEVYHRENGVKVYDAEAWLAVKNYHAITAAPAANGSVAASVTEAVEGDTVNLTLSPASGYELDTLTVLDEDNNEISLSGTSFVMPDTPVTVQATFKTAVMYNVTVLPCNGITVTLNKQSALEGETITLRTTLAADYTLDSITAVDGNGDPVTLSPRTDGAGYQFTMPASDVTITPVTSYNPKYQLWVGGVQVTGNNCTDILGDGTVSYEPTTRTLSFSSAEPAITGENGGNFVTYYGEDSLTIDAPNGLHLDASEFPSVSNAIYSYYADFIINGDVTLTASNGIKSYNGTVTVNGNVTGNVGSILIQGNAGVTINGSLTSTNTENYRAIYTNGAVSISGDFSSACFKTCGIYAAGDITIGGDVTFAPNPGGGEYALHSAGGDISIGGDVTIVNNSGSGKGIYAADGAINVGSGIWDVSAASQPLKAKNGISIPAASTITLPEGGSVGSSGGFAVIVDAEAAPAAHVIIQPGQTLVYNVSVSSEITNGSVTADKATAAAGETVTLTVTPAEGYVLASLTRITGDQDHFTEITDKDQNGNYFFTMPAGNVTIYAQFDKAPEPLTDGYYLIGPDWNLAAIDSAEKFEGPDNGGQYKLRTFLEEDDKIKVVKVENNTITAWYPGGTGNEYIVDAAHAGLVDIYFRTSYYNDWSAFGGHIWINAPMAEIYACSLSLKDYIGINYYVFIPDSLRADANAYVTLTPKKVDENETPPDPLTIQISEAYEAYHRTINGRTVIQFRIPLTAKEMGRVVTLRVYNGDGTLATLINKDVDITETGYSFSIRQYITFVRESDDPIYTPALKALVDAMWNYGICAQYAFSFDVANAPEMIDSPNILTPDDVTLEDLERFKAEKTLAGDSPVVYSLSSAVLKSNTSIRHYFKINSGSVSDYTFKVGQDTVTPKQVGSYYQVEITGIVAKELDKAYVVTVTDANDTELVRIEYSVLSYCWAAVNDGSLGEDVTRVVKALYLYWYYADIYFPDS